MGQQQPSRSPRLDALRCTAQVRPLEGNQVQLLSSPKEVGKLKLSYYFHASMLTDGNR